MGHYSHNEVNENRLNKLKCDFLKKYTENIVLERLYKKQQAINYYIGEYVDKESEHANVSRIR